MINGETCSPKENKGGIAYEVILKQASVENKSVTPCKDRSISYDMIERKLREAEERRSSLEATKLEQISRDSERILEARKKVAEADEIFRDLTEKRLSEKLGSVEENKNALITALQQRLKEHAQRVSEVSAASERYSESLKEKIENKMERMQGNRDSVLRSIQERIRDHEKHISDALAELSLSTESHIKSIEEKHIQKMEKTLKKRETQLSLVLAKLQEHEKRVDEVRKNKSNNSDDPAGLTSSPTADYCSPLSPLKAWSPSNKIETGKNGNGLEEADCREI